MSSFFANTTKLLGGNAFAQAIGIIAIPIITRLYSTEQFGSFAIILSIATIISSISTLGFHLAILIPKDQSKAKALVALSLISLLLTSAPIVIIAEAFPDLVKSYLGESIDQETAYIILAMVILQGLYSIASYWSIRERKFGIVATSKVFESVSDRGISIGVVAFGWASALSLSFARICGVLSSLVFLALSMRHLKTEQPIIKPHCKTAPLYSTFKDFKEYVIYNTPSVLLINAMGQLPTIMIGYFYSPVAAGLYAIATRLVTIPVKALGSALSTTVTQHFASLVSQDDLQSAKANAISMHSKLFAFLLIPFSFICVAGEFAVEILLGPEWLEAGTFVQWMSYFAFSTLMAQAFGGLFDVMKRQKTRLKFHIANFILRIGVLLACGYMDFPVISTIAYYAIIANLMNILAVSIAFEGIGAHREVLRSILRNAAAPLIMILSFWWLSKFFSPIICLAISSLYCIIWATILLKIFYSSECAVYYKKISSAL